MKMSGSIFAISLLAIFTPAVEGRGLRVDANEGKNRPVSKVVTLLKDMKEQLEKEAEEDQEVYDKMACWCTTNDKDKTQAIIDAEARITDLTAHIEDLTAQSSRLNQEIKQLNEEVAKNSASLDTATALRTKQLAEFTSEEKEMIQCVQSLKAAIVVLSKHHPTALLDDSVDDSAMLDIPAMVHHIMRKHKDLLLDVITPKQRKVLSSMLQAAPYAPASGEIFGILKQMKETFESDLSVSQKEELTNQAAYEELKTAKEAEISAGQNAIETKTQELANVDEKNAQAKEDIEDTMNSLSADEKFLMDLKSKCQMTDQEWEQRQKTRLEEMTAVSEAISILASDDAHDLFSKTLGFVQKTSKNRIRIMQSDRRMTAAKLLTQTGERLHNPRMVQIATQVRLDAFTKVKKAIDDMVAQLEKEQADEVKHRDYCIDNLNQNEKTTESTERDKSDVNMKIEDLTMTIEKLDKEVAALKAEIAELNTQLKRAGEDRELENKDFQQTVADQRATQKLLNQALSVLKGFYEKKAEALVQTGLKDAQGPPPPPAFKSYKKSGGAGGVMGMITQIINDAKAMETEALRDEEEAQRAYEGFVKETNRSVEEKSTGITNKEEDKAKAESEKTATEEEKSEVVLSLEQLANEGADLHKSCDFVVKNFDIRQEARSQEVEALKQAKAILSGAKFQFLLQEM